MELTIQTLQKHLGRHLEEVALFVLPYPGSGKGGESKSIEGGNSIFGNWSDFESESDSENPVQNQPMQNQPVIPPATIQGIRCICGYQHDDGFLITCEKCKELQHGVCMGIDENSFLEAYECSACMPGAYHLDIEASINTQESFLKSGSRVQASKDTEVPPQTGVAPALQGLNAVVAALKLFPHVLGVVTNIAGATYASATEKGKQMGDHKGTLDDFKRELEMERMIFENTWDTLRIRSGVNVEPNVDPSPEIVQAISSCLLPHAVNTFFNDCQELTTVLTGLKTKLEIYEQDLVGIDYVLIWLYH